MINSKILLKRGLIGSVIMLFFYLLILLLLWIFRSSNYFPMFSILMPIQYMLFGFLLGTITGFFKYRIKKDFLISTKAKIIIFYLFLIPSFIFPSIFVPLASCCDCFGPACTLITGLPFPITIFGEIGNIALNILSVILFIGIIGFILNVIFYYLISASVVFIYKYFFRCFKLNK